MRNMRRRVLWLIVLAAGMCLAGSARAEEKIIAVVNNEIITQRDLDSFLNFMRVQLSQQYSATELEEKIAAMKADLLDRLIEDRLILQEAKKSNVVVDESRIKGKLEEVKKRYSSDRDFERSLTEQGLVAADLEAKIREQQMMYDIVGTKIRKKISVKPSEITAYYTKNQPQFSVPEEREFQSLVGSDEAKAKSAVEALRAAKDITVVSVDSGFALSTFSARRDGELKKEIENALFSLKIGDISDPMSIKGSYYIFKLNKIRQPRQQPLSDVQDAIHDQLYERKMQEAMVRWIDELKKKAYIKKS